MRTLRIAPHRSTPLRITPVHCRRRRRRCCARRLQAPAAVGLHTALKAPEDKFIRLCPQYPGDRAYGYCLPLP
ncbi:hypothetical protein HYH02_010965 [Chlamydomonas schloesseri]|uniref:Uncharacterized protein n=1 Tax=Chlamydomonas schloesseri TaxID=2026947 RepID=A0A835W2L6_9CHLO|nr:hypothetical protein HYH02_010965 [Chlamydomonas schloesseri]|eukprot:KAG2438267.1 hypothetical protein HYH02_010965 [Chlamydomonas schloesseri]